MNDTLLKILVILGSTRQNRFSEKPGRYILDELKKVERVDAELIDFREWDLPFYNEPASPSYTKGPYANDMGNKWKAKVGEADAFIIVAPEYNHGYPAVLKNALDWVYSEWNNKPVGFVSYGAAMGTRSVEQLRQVLVELQLVSIRNAIHLPSEIYMAAVNGPYDAKHFQSLREGQMDRVQGFFDQLLWWARTLKVTREAKK